MLPYPAKVVVMTFVLGLVPVTQLISRDSASRGRLQNDRGQDCCNYSKNVFKTHTHTHAPTPTHTHKITSPIKFYIYK